MPADDQRRRLDQDRQPAVGDQPVPAHHAAARPVRRGAPQHAAAGNDDLALFEAGSVFLAADPRCRPAARRSTAAPVGGGARGASIAALRPRSRGISPPCWPAQWRAGRLVRDRATAAGWQQAIAFVEAAARRGRRRSSTGRGGEYAPWHPGRCAEFTVADADVIGHAGELHPEVCTAFGLPARTAAAEIDLDALIAAAPADRADIAAISGFPVAKEDVALIVDDDVPAAEVERGAARRRRDRCWSRSGCSTCTPVRRSARARSRWPTRSASGLRTVRLTEAEAADARDACRRSGGGTYRGCAADRVATCDEFRVLWRSTPMRFSPTEGALDASESNGRNQNRSALCGDSRQVSMGELGQSSPH